MYFGINTDVFRVRRPEARPGWRANKDLRDRGTIQTGIGIRFCTPSATITASTLELYVPGSIMSGCARNTLT